MLQDLFTYLTTAPGPEVDPVRAAALNAIQAKIQTRLFPDFLTERATMPAGRYVLIGNTLEYTLAGDTVDLAWPEVQLDWYASNPEDRDLLGEQAKIALGGYIGAMGSTNIGMLIFNTELNGFEATPLQYSRMQRFKVIHYSDDSASAPAAVPGINGASRHEPVEAIDGVRTSFTFLGIPSVSTKYLVAVNGLVTCQGVTQAGDVLTFETAPWDLCVFY